MTYHIAADAAHTSSYYFQSQPWFTNTGIQALFTLYPTLVEQVPADLALTPKKPVIVLESGYEWNVDPITNRQISTKLLVYFPTSTTFTINLSALAAGSVTASWFNTEHNYYYSAGSYSTLDGSVSFTPPPSFADAVLVLTANPI
jgi:hypothetical protein